MSMDANVFVPLTKLKGKNECVQSDFLKGYIIENNNDDRVKDIFALVVYGTLIFPQSPRYIDAAQFQNPCMVKFDILKLLFSKNKIFEKTFVR